MRRRLLVTILGVVALVLVGLGVPLGWILGVSAQQQAFVVRQGDTVRFSVPLAIWVMRGFIMSIPEELEYAARIDGATRFGAMVRVVLPLLHKMIHVVSL